MYHDRFLENAYASMLLKEGVEDSNPLTFEQIIEEIERNFIPELYHEITKRMYVLDRLSDRMWVDLENIRKMNYEGVTFDYDYKKELSNITLGLLTNAATDSVEAKLAHRSSRLWFKYNKPTLERQIEKMYGGGKNRR